MDTSDSDSATASVVTGIVADTGTDGEPDPTVPVSVVGFLALPDSPPTPSAPDPSPILFRRSTMRRSMAPYVPDAAGADLTRQTRPRRSVRFSATVAPSPSHPAPRTPPVPDPATPTPVATTTTTTTEPLQPTVVPELPTLFSSAAPLAEPETESSSGVTGNCRLPDETEEQRSRRVGGLWPHGPCFLASCLSCTVGLFDICRVAYLSFQYGGGFVLQFLMLTVVFGLPLFSFQMAIGQYMGAGLMDMWKASPIFKGAGISSVIAMSLIGVYNVVPVSWMFVYFRDAFVTNLTFKWGECSNVHSDDECKTYAYNSSDILRLSIPAYYQKRVLQRGPQPNNTNMMDSAELVFENVFNMAVIWMIVFICLSKGIKSYGKVVLAFGIFPVVSFYLIAIEILRRASTGAELILSYQTDMKEFFLNGWSWLSAAREVFFIWGINGAVVMQMASHNKANHNLKRDCAIIILVTLSIFLLAAFLGCANVFIIYKMNPGQQFIPSSFETLMSSRFLAPVERHQDVSQYMSINYLLGVESTTSSVSQKASGYQVSRFATELYPMAMVSLGPKRISAFWPVLFYLCLITFGVARQLAVWRCVVEGFLAVCPEKLRPWETSITFLTCIFGFLLGLPFATQVGIYAVHFMDVCVGSAWWIMIIYLVQVFALLLIRGRPYSGDDIVLTLMDTQPMRKWLAPIVSFSWNIVLPVTLLVLSIASFRLGNFGRMFSVGDDPEYEHWPGWAKQIGAFIQIVPIVVIPLVALVQSVRYLSDRQQGTMAQKIERLIRPSPSSGHRTRRRSVDANGDTGTPNFVAGGGPADLTPVSPHDDPPPKYTPPPSYNTATGLKLLKSLNSSFRSSVRRARAAISRSSVWGVGGAAGVAITTPSGTDVEMQTPIVERRASEDTQLSLDVTSEMDSIATTTTTVDEDSSLPGASSTISSSAPVVSGIR